MIVQTGRTGHPPRLAAGCLVLFLAFSLKLWARTATAADLQWILGPLARLTSLWTGIRFTFDPLLGYISSEAQVLIAPACSGLNFMLIVLCMTAFQGILRLSRPQTLWYWTAATPLMAYGCTLLVNTIRILLALQLFAHGIAGGWFTLERVHRLSGILIYYLALMVLYAGTNRLLGKMESAKQTRPIPFLAHSPFFWYAGSTLVIPLLHRPTYDLTFWEHSLSILCGCALLTLLSRMLRRQ